MKADLIQLQELADLRFNVSVARLAPVTKREMKLREALGALRQPVVLAANPERPFLAQRSGAQHAWEVWASNRMLELNRKLALVLAEKEELLCDARREFGRKEAVKYLIEAQKKPRR